MNRQQSMRQFVRDLMDVRSAATHGEVKEAWYQTKRAYPRKVVPLGYIRQIVREWWRDGGPQRVKEDRRQGTMHAK